MFTDVRVISLGTAFNLYHMIGAAGRPAFHFLAFLATLLYDVAQRCLKLVPAFLTVIFIVIVHSYEVMRPQGHLRPTTGKRAEGSNPDHHSSLGIIPNIDRGEFSDSLHDAASEGLEQTIVKQLNEGAAINGLDRNGSTALQLAVKQGHVGTEIATSPES